MNIMDIIGNGGIRKLGEGLELHLTPLTPAMQADFRAHRQRLVPDPLEGIEVLANKLNDAAAKQLISEAWKAHENWGSIYTEEGRQWMSGWDGTVFQIYLMSRKHHPELTLEELEDKLRAYPFTMLQVWKNIIDEISGFRVSPPKRERRPSRKPPKKHKKK